jgi:hypothetical protein
MPITINGAGSIVGITAGGLPDASVVTADIAAAKLSGAQTGTAPIYGCRAWVNFDGTRNEADTGASTNGANVKIRASGNVSSVLKNGTGNYTVNFTAALPDANYVVTGAVSNTANNWSSGAAELSRGPSGLQQFGTTAPTTSSCRIETLIGASSGADGGVVDFSSTHVAIFR